MYSNNVNLYLGGLKMTIRKKLGLLVVIIMLVQLFMPIICHAENLVSIKCYFIC